MLHPRPQPCGTIRSDGLATRLRDADEVIRELKERLGENEISTRKHDEADDDDSESETAKILKQTE